MSERSSLKGPAQRENKCAIFVVKRPDNSCIFCLSGFPKPLSSSEFLSEPPIPSSSLADPLEGLSIIHNGHCVEKPSCSSPQESSSPRGWCLQISNCHVKDTMEVFLNFSISSSSPSAISAGSVIKHLRDSSHCLHSSSSDDHHPPLEY